MTDTLRTFVSIATPEAVRATLMLAQEWLERHCGNLIRLTPPAQLHLTLKFLGDVERDALPKLEECISSACGNFASLTLRLDRTGVFPDRGPARVLWVAWTGEGLFELQRAIEKNLSAIGFCPEERPFAPHITVARVGRNLPSEAHEVWLSRTLPTASSTIHSVELMQSVLEPQGARHECLATVPFGG